MEQKQKRKGKSETLIDSIDHNIMKVLSNNKRLTMTELRNKIGLTHSNLTTHMKRLKNIIERERDKQTIYVSLNSAGHDLVKSIKKLKT
ncbi:MAG: winged helix-turn-helix transcriptional regulator [Nanoarchaeota archaeon]|nr:winged helix-turn-helix transcriptional regulator [Nanoarchaeota archaeon]